MTDKVNNIVRHEALNAADAQGYHECSIGYIRYQALKRLTPDEFKAMKDREVTSECIDATIDRIIFNEWKKRIHL